MVAAFHKNSLGIHPNLRLIKTTICPKSWREGGGNFQIFSSKKKTVKIWWGWCFDRCPKLFFSDGIPCLYIDHRHEGVKLIKFRKILGKIALPFIETLFQIL